MAAIKYGDGEVFKDWFKSNDAPFWQMRDNKDRTGKFIATNTGGTAISGIDESFVRLENAINWFKADGGSFWISTKKNNNESGFTNEVNVIVAAPYSADSAGMAGIGNINHQMQPAAVNIGAELTRAKKEWDLERKLEDLEAQINAPPEKDWIARSTEIINGLLQNPIIAGIAAKVAGLNPAMMAQVGGEYAPDSATPLEEESGDLETAIEYFNEAGFNDKEILKFAKFVKSNPEMAKGMFKNLAQ